ncbi:MAG: hypothetical protein KatS3mg111_1097 [Pirellulaceae bacterium]|nr:MAG: hypothetical protein KatS3mg111_1097 [Pirellulaceae bacterium]
MIADTTNQAVGDQVRRAAIVQGAPHPNRCAHCQQHGEVQRPSPRIGTGQATTTEHGKRGDQNRQGPVKGRAWPPAACGSTPPEELHRRDGEQPQDQPDCQANGPSGLVMTASVTILDTTDKIEIRFIAKRTDETGLRLQQQGYRQGPARCRQSFLGKTLSIAVHGNHGGPIVLAEVRVANRHPDQW